MADDGVISAYLRELRFSLGALSRRCSSSSDSSATSPSIAARPGLRDRDVAGAFVPLLLITIGFAWLGMHLWSEPAVDEPGRAQPLAAA